jgi:hypothetical protein
MTNGNEAMQCLRQCFSAKHWAVLKKNKDFQSVLSTIKTLDDVQRASTLAEEILRAAKTDEED